MNLISKRKSRVSSRENDASSSVSVPEVSKSKKKRSRNQKDSIDGKYVEMVSLNEKKILFVLDKLFDIFRLSISFFLI